MPAPALESVAPGIVARKSIAYGAECFALSAVAEGSRPCRPLRSKAAADGSRPCRPRALESVAHGIDTRKAAAIGVERPALKGGSRRKPALRLALVD